MLPIPKSLLRQTAAVRVPRDGAFGGEYEEALAIEHVRFEPCAAIRQTDYQLQAPVAGTLFVDAVNSSPAMEVPAGSLVSVDGEVSEACVQECRVIRGAGSIHHWEAVLA